MQSQRMETSYPWTDQNLKQKHKANAKQKKMCTTGSWFYFMTKSYKFAIALCAKLCETKAHTDYFQKFNWRLSYYPVCVRLQRFLNSDLGTVMDKYWEKGICRRGCHIDCIQLWQHWDTAIKMCSSSYTITTNGKCFSISMNTNFQKLVPFNGEQLKIEKVSMMICSLHYQCGDRETTRVPNEKFFYGKLWEDFPI